MVLFVIWSLSKTYKVLNLHYLDFFFHYERYWKQLNTNGEKTEENVRNVKL